MIASSFIITIADKFVASQTNSEGNSVTKAIAEMSLFALVLPWMEEGMVLHLRRPYFSSESKKLKVNPREGYIFCVNRMYVTNITVYM